MYTLLRKSICVNPLAMALLLSTENVEDMNENKTHNCHTFTNRLILDFGEIRQTLDAIEM